MIAVFAARILSVAHRDHPISDVDIGPFKVANFLPAASQLPKRSGQFAPSGSAAAVGFEMSNQIIQLPLRRTPIALVCLAYETQAGEGDTASRTSSGITSMPWTAAACVKSVPMNEKSMA